MIFRNSLLNYLGDHAQAALSPHIQEISLTSGRIIAEPGEPAEHVYFPSSGVVSIVTLLQSGRRVESQTVGREGALGLLETFGEPTWTSRGLVQVPGGALRIAASVLHRVGREQASVMDTIIRYAQATEAQLHQSAACNALHSIEARLCRWLLTCEDQVGDSVLPLTHEFLGMMLGVQRTRVTTASQALRSQGLIDYRRGNLTMLDRPGIESAACECYRINKDIYQTMFPASGRTQAPAGHA
jgi:CRP-like cAMP-binding protein